jgi:PadR family transcriptional regulator PadR
MIPSQMLKGTLECCILKVISQRKPTATKYQKTCGRMVFTDISEGTIYPLLLRLEKNGLITAQYPRIAGRTKTKVFFSFFIGKEEIERFYSSWLELEQAVGALFHEGGK